MQGKSFKKRSVSQQLCIQFFEIAVAALQGATLLPRRSHKQIKGTFNF